jgi:hypothetical protein
MALQIRRGVDGSGTGGRLTITPDTGELLYTTDTKRLYVGDGTTVGGNIISGGGLSNVVEDTTPQLGGDLDLGNFNIITTGNTDLTITAGSSGNIYLGGNITRDGGISIIPSSTNAVTTPAVVSVGDPLLDIDGNFAITKTVYSAAVGSGFTYAQHHSTVAAVPALFWKTRGTASVPTAVLNNDRLSSILFAGHDGTGAVVSAGINVTVSGSITTGNVPARITFVTNNGTSTASRAELTALGAWKVNDVQNLSGTDLTLTATNIKMVGNVQLNAQNDLRFADADSSNWVAFQAPATVAANVTWTLPATDGTTGQVLATNGSGVLSWVAASGGAGFASRVAIPGTTATLANGATGNIAISGVKGYILYKIQTTVAAWVRIYTTSAARSADSSRAEGVDPLPGAGVIAEVITTGAQTIIMSPGVIGFNDDNAPTTSIYLAITNKSGASSTVTATLTILQIEA